MRRLALAVCIAACVLTIAPAQVTAGSSQRLFEIPGHGLLGLEAMGYWEQEVDFQSEDSLPRIHMYHNGGMFTADGSERIRVTVMPAWRTPDTPPDFGTEQGVRRIVREYADEMEALLDLSSLKLVPIGRERIGFWFLASDKGFFSSRLDDGFSYVRRGALVAGELVVTFTILTDEEPSISGDFAALLMSHTELLPGTCVDVSTSCYSHTNNLRSSANPR